MRILAQYVKSVLAINLTPGQLSAFEVYQRELFAWNQLINLTAIHEPDAVDIKHFLDSLTCLKIMQDTSMKQVIDIGTGAGFPGIPLKIVCPSLRLTLVESVKKKVAFCQHVVQVLRLSSIKVLHDRAERIGQKSEHREAYDWAVARAVAQLPVLAEFLLPLVRLGGTMIAMKGESAPAEVHQAENAIRILGGSLRNIIPVTLPCVVEERYLVVVDKVAATPDNYPRRIGIPKKRPL